MSRTSSHVLGIDVLRFLAAALVASLHLWAPGESGFVDHLTKFVLPGSTGISPVVLPPVAFVGSMGVQIFFMISGYVISDSAYGTSGVYDFLYRRTMRLLPGLWICTILTVGIALLTSYYTPSDALMRTIRSFILFPIGPKVDDVVWTLNLEVVFYCYIASFIFLNKIEKIPLLAFGLAFVSLVYWSSYFMLGCSPSGIDGLERACQIFKNGFSFKLCSILLLQHGGFFAAGMFLWTATKFGFKATHVAGLILSSCACILQLIWTSKYYLWQSGIYWEPTIWAVAMIFMAISIIYNEETYRTLGSYSSFIRSLGLATYPLYLCHNFIGGLILAVMAKLGAEGLFAFSIALIVSTCVAAWIATSVEPALRNTIDETAFDLRIHPVR
jgi:peptidoglycan/LPS O-acetylase OafA/YrhL